MRKFERISVDDREGAYIRGTAIPVTQIVKRIQAGEPLEKLLEAYPKLEIEDVVESLAYAVVNLVRYSQLWRSEGYPLLASIQGVGQLLAQIGDVAESQSKEFSQIIISNSDRVRLILDSIYFGGHLGFMPQDEREGPVFILDVTKKLSRRVASSGHIEFILPVDVPPMRGNVALNYALTSLFDARWSIGNYGFETSVKVTLPDPEHLNVHVNHGCQEDVDIERFFWYGSPLYISRLIVQEHGSQLQAQSTEHGVTFEFQLPIWKEPQS